MCKRCIVSSSLIPNFFNRPYKGSKLLIPPRTTVQNADELNTSLFMFPRTCWLIVPDIRGDASSVKCSLLAQPQGSAQALIEANCVSKRRTHIQHKIVRALARAQLSAKRVNLYRFELYRYALEGSINWPKIKRRGRNKVAARAHKDQGTPLQG